MVKEGSFFFVWGVEDVVFPKTIDNINAVTFLVEKEVVEMLFIR